MSKAVVIFNQEYVGFEALFDIKRDVSEAIVITSINPLDVGIPDGEFRGTITVTMTYTPETNTK